MLTKAKCGDRTTSQPMGRYKGGAIDKKAGMSGYVKSTHMTLSYSGMILTFVHRYSGKLLLLAISYIFTFPLSFYYSHVIMC